MPTNWSALRRKGNKESLAVEYRKVIPAIFCFLRKYLRAHLLSSFLKKMIACIFYSVNKLAFY